MNEEYESFGLFDDQYEPFELYEGQNDSNTLPTPPRRLKINLNNAECRDRDKYIEKIKEQIRRKQKEN